MNIEKFRLYCLSKKGVTEEFPFDKKTLVFKVMGKMFALTGLENEIFKVNLKCDPDTAIELREKYPEVAVGYHMNKKHWNTVSFEGNLSEKLLLQMIDDSYTLVVAGLKKADKIKLNDL